RLHGIAQRTYRTDTDGSVEITFDGPTLRVHSSGPRRTAAVGPALARAAIPGTPPGSVRAASFVCAIPVGGATVAPGRQTDHALVLRESPLPIRVRTGPTVTTQLRAAGQVSLLPLPERAIGAALALGYHRPDADIPGAGDRAGPRGGSPRLFLGR